MSLEAEQTIIGILLNDTSNLHAVKERICAEDFEDATFQVAFAKIVSLADAGVEVTPFSVASQFGENARCTIAKYLDTLFGECSSTQNIVAWSDILKEQSVQRKLIQCANMLKTAEDFAQYFEEIAAEFRQSDLTIEWVAEVMVTTSEILTKLYREVQED